MYFLNKKNNRMSAYIEIPNLYDEALKAKLNGDLEKAAKLFVQCHNLYQTAELPVFSESIKQKGEDAYYQYKSISSYVKDIDDIIQGE